MLQYYVMYRIYYFMIICFSYKLLLIRHHLIKSYSIYTIITLIV